MDLDVVFGLESEQEFIDQLFCPGVFDQPIVVVTFPRYVEDRLVIYQIVSWYASHNPQ